MLLAPFVWSSAWREDELSQLANAARMLGGETLYRDYFEFYAPLSFWLAAGLFALTGPSLLAAHVVTALAVGASALLVRALVRQLGGGAAAGAIAAAAVVLGCFRAFPVWNHHWIALPFALGAAVLAVRGVADPRGRGWAGAGALIGLTLLTTQSDGLVALAALALVLGALALLGPWRPADARDAAKRAALGFAAPVGLAALVLAAQGALDDAWRCTWVWPRAHYQAAGGVNDALFGHDLGFLIGLTNGPWPGRLGFYARLYHLGWLYAAFAGALGVGLVWAAGLAARRLRGERLAPAAARWGVAVAFGVAFTALAMRGRADYAHVAVYAPWTLALVAAAAGALRPLLAGLAGALVAWLPLATVAAFAATGGLLALDEARRHPAHWLSASPPDARLAASEVVRYVRDHTGPHDRIVALPQGSIAYFYGRPSAADMNILLPPRFRYTDEADYQALWRRIEERKPALILVTPDHPVAAELADHLRYPLPAYTHAAIVETPAHDGPRKTWVLRRTAP